MGANVPESHVTTVEAGKKIKFSYFASIKEQRNEAWAQQQQSLLGFKIKKHGFNDFKETPNEINGFHNFEWWCWKETTDHLKNQLGDKLESHEEVEEVTMA